jgi:hypothetical protein
MRNGRPTPHEAAINFVEWATIALYDPLNSATTPRYVVNRASLFVDRIAPIFKYTAPLCPLVCLI